jgi:hypothetical protein
MRNFIYTILIPCINAVPFRLLKAQITISGCWLRKLGIQMIRVALLAIYAKTIKNEAANTPITGLTLIFGDFILLFMHF